MEPQAVALSVLSTIFVDIVTVKAISFVVILAIAIVGGLIPLVSAKSTNSERFFSLGNAFAGGLFLGVGFIHLLPEGMEMLGAYSEFPWGAVTATAGFGVLLLLDRILFPEYRVGDSLRNSGTETIYPYVLLAMLSIHSIVAGIALGLEEHVAAAATLLIGIVFHKGPAAFALILSTHMAGIGRSRQKAFLAFFCVMTPLGIVLGVSSSVVFATSSGVYGVMQGVFNAFAAGTFIYIAVIDIIDKELTTHQLQIARYTVSAVVGEDDVPMPRQGDDRLAKFVLIVVGIVLVAWISDWTHGTHGGHGPETGTELHSDSNRIDQTPKHLEHHEQEVNYEGALDDAHKVGVELDALGNREDIAPAESDGDQPAHVHH